MEQHSADGHGDFDAFFYIALDPLCIADTAGHFLRVNPAWEGVLGYSVEELEGSSYLDRVNPDDVANTRDVVGRLKERESVFGFVNRLRAKDGSYRWIEWQSSSPDGRLVYAAARDITEARAAEEAVVALNAELEGRVQERTEQLASTNEELTSLSQDLTSLTEAQQCLIEEIEETNRRLDEATRAKSEFLASMSHELRTPLNSILGFSGTLFVGMAGPLEDEQRKQVGMINAAGRHLLELINGVLDLAKIESGHVTIVPEDVSVADIVAEALDTVRPLAEAKGLALSSGGAETAGTVRSDRTGVLQILLNLLGNAVKFTEEGAVVLDVTRSEAARLSAPGWASASPAVSPRCWARASTSRASRDAGPSSPCASPRTARASRCGRTETAVDASYAA